MIALDTNLLVYAHRAGVQQHRQAIEAIDRAINQPLGWGVSAPCIAEFWAVVTHPSCEGGPSSPAQAAEFILRLLEDGAGKLWHPGPGFGLRLIQRASDIRLSGKRIFDLQIALVAYENGASEMWSHDHNFVCVPGLKLCNPFAPEDCRP